MCVASAHAVLIFSLDVAATSPTADEVVAPFDKCGRNGDGKSVSSLSGCLASLDVTSEVGKQSADHHQAACRDSSADGAEDSAAGSVTELEVTAVSSSKGDDAGQGAGETNGEIANACGQRTVSVSKLQSGVYVTKSTGDARRQQHLEHPNRQQFPLLQNLEGAGSGNNV
jgi:hypothetical protein